MRAHTYNARYLREPSTEKGKCAHRQRSIENVAINSAHVVSWQIAAAEPLTRDQVRLNKSALEAALDRYWKLVVWFKKDQKFEPDARINCPKKAALTIYSVWTAREPIFLGDPVDIHPTHIDMANLIFAGGIMSMFMDVKVEKIENRHLKDLAVVLKNMRENFKTDNLRPHLLSLCLYMDAFWTAQGKTDGPNGD